MNDRSAPSLRGCLAYAVLGDYETWLGTPSPSCLSVFLNGAEARACLLEQALPAWRVYGPLEIPEFYLPLVARTGHPTLSIKWATAVELSHFSLVEAMCEIRTAVEAWVRVHGLVTDEIVHGFADPAGLNGLLKKLATRPALYLGLHSRWALRCFLAGMDRGGDWLGLPPLPGLRAVVDGLEERSEESYGSRFAAYRVYETSPSELLGWVGVTPE
jgi:hypothetical protein